jgi:4'-phosphopantetheinyl transferase
VHFNLSHCKNGIAVVVDFSPVGIDIEYFRKSNLALVKKTMNPFEAEWIRSSANPVEAFTQYWTKKEAVVKMRGTGITDDLHRVLDGEGYRIESFVNREKYYAWSVAYSV